MIFQTNICIASTTAIDVVVGGHLMDTILRRSIITIILPWYDQFDPTSFSIIGIEALSNVDLLEQTKIANIKLNLKSLFRVVMVDP